MIDHLIFNHHSESISAIAMVPTVVFNENTNTFGNRINYLVYAP